MMCDVQQCLLVAGVIVVVRQLSGAFTSAAADEGMSLVCIHSTIHSLRLLSQFHCARQLSISIIPCPQQACAENEKKKIQQDCTSPALQCTPVTPFPPTGDAAYRQRAGERPSHGHRHHARKFGKDRACGSGDILADRETHRHTDRHTHHSTSQPISDIKTSDQSNLTKRPHRHRTWTV